MKKQIIPTHEFYDRLEQNIPFDFISLSEKSNYDPLNYHRHAYYEIFFFIKGGGRHDIDFDTFTVGDYSIHFVSPGQIHMLQRELNSNGYIILFSREFYQLELQNIDTLYELPFLNNNTSRPIVSIPEKNRQDNVQLFERMKAEFASDNKDKEEVLRANLNLLMLDAKRLFLQQTDDVVNKPNPKNDLIRRFRIAIEKNFVHMHKPGEYADILFVSSGHLNDVVKELLGVSSSDIINERLLLEIKRMLLHSSESVNEIAQLLNFEDPSYFARFFKNHTGVSPKEFRQTIREKYQ